MNAAMKPFCAAVLAAALSASGESPRTVRVAFCRDAVYAGFAADGARTGFAVDLVSGIAARLGWEIEWIEAPCCERLRLSREHRLDILPCLVNAAEIRGDVLVGHVPVGYCRMGLFALSGSQLDLENSRSLDGLVIGVIRGDALTGRLKRRFEDAGLSFVLREYPDRAQLEQSLLTGETGAVFSEIDGFLANEKPLLSFPPEPMYLCVAPGSQEILDELDAAFAAIADGEPGFLADLRRRYFGWEITAPDGCDPGMTAGDDVDSPAWARMSLSEQPRAALPALLAMFVLAVIVLLAVRRKMARLLHRSNMSLEVANRMIKESAEVRKELKTALEKAEFGARSRTNFLSTMSHEIRTPLNAVIGYSELLNSPSVTPEQIREYAGAVSVSANALLSLVSDILDITRFESGSREELDLRKGECDLASLVDRLRTVFAERCREKGLGLDFSVVDGRPWLQLDPVRFRQLVLNLAGNAVKFTDSGLVKIRIGYDEEVLTVIVSDTGIGITAAGLRHIFDPFTQDMESRLGKVYAGTGLGLAIVRRLVESSGGTVSVESEVGRGSTFTVRIPGVKRLEGADRAPQVRAAQTVLTGGPSGVPERKPEESSAAAGAPEPPAAKSAAVPPVSSGQELRSILVVDDVKMNRQILQLHCRSQGIADVRTFASGEEVLAYLDTGALPDLVLTDLWMPGMDGAQLAKALKNRCPTLPVVAVTADTDPGSKFDLSPFAEILFKPVTGERLKELFGKLGMDANTGGC